MCPIELRSGRLSSTSRGLRRNLARPAYTSCRYFAGPANTRRDDPASSAYAIQGDFAGPANTRRDDPASSAYAIRA